MERRAPRCMAGVIATAGTMVICVAARGQVLPADSVDRLLDRSFKEREAHPEQALGWARTALHWAGEHQDSLRIADAWRKIALAQHERPVTLDTSFMAMEYALRISTSIGDAVGEQSAAKSLGKWYKERGDYDRALGYADRSLRVAEAAKDTKGICSALVTKGTIQKGLGDMEGAAATLYRGLELARELNDTAKTLNLLNNIGNCYFELEQSEEARAYFQEQYALATSAHKMPDLAAAKRNMAMIAAKGGQWPRAVELVDSALIMMVDAGVPMDERFTALGNKADYLMELGRLTEARSTLERAVEISKDLDRPTDRSLMLSDLGDIDLREGRLDRGDTVLHSALLEAGTNQRARMVALRLLSTLRERQGRWEEAQDLLSAYIAARDSFIDVEATDQLARAEMRQRYKAHEQDLEIRDLGDRIAEERRLRNLVLGITLLALLLAALAWRNWRFQRKLRLQANALHGHEVAQLMKQQEIRALDAVLKGQEQERARIAKELHDRVGMLLSAVKMQFGALEGRIQHVQATAGAQYQRVTDLLDTAVGEVRRISHDMEHSNLATFGLATALEDLRDAVHVPGRLEVELNTFGLAERLDKRLEIAAYRMVQEAVSNALKHAKADHLSMQVTRSEALLNILVEDDGTGFDPGAGSEGMGMSNLRSRAAEFNGSVRIDSLPGRGTTVVIDLPIAPKTP
jgi:two-component system NarL family sensor kinase